LFAGFVEFTIAKAGYRAAIEGRSDVKAEKKKPLSKDLR